METEKLVSPESLKRRVNVRAEKEARVESLIHEYGADSLPPLRSIRRERLRRDPSLVMDMAGFTPDWWQREVIRATDKRILELISRQQGKSLSAGGRGYVRSALDDENLTLLVSRSERQAGELFRKVMMFHDRLDLLDITHRSALSVEFSNGSRVVALPGNEETVRSFSGVNELLLDEASRIPDSLYYSVRPMLAVSKGTLMLLSTPWGKRGFFYKEYSEFADAWKIYKVVATECPRITTEFLQEELRAVGDLWFRQEYLCEFVDTIETVFSEDLIKNLVDPNIKPLFEKAPMAEKSDAELKLMETLAQLKDGKIEDFTEGLIL